MNNNTAYSHYDDNNMIITSGKNKPKAKQNAPGTKAFRELDGDEIVDLKKIALNDARKLQTLRNNCKLSQPELAKKFSIPDTIIRDFENGKGSPNKVLFNKIIRYLENHIKNNELPKI